MDAELKIKIGAETQGAESGIKKVTQALGNLKPGANQATFALTNLSRVAQDAPFGLIGIANNIEPLITSFRSLGAETKTVKGFFTALGSSLMGGGGLILGVGLASTAMSLLGNTFSKTAKQSDEAKESLRALNVVEGEAVASIRGRSAELIALLGIVKNNTLSERERLNALTQIRDVDKTLTEGITLQASSLNILTTRVNEYTQSLIQAAIVKEFSSEIAKAAKEEDKQSRIFEAARNRVTIATKAYQAAQRNPGGGASSAIGGGADDLTGKLGAASDELRLANEALRIEEEKLFKVGVDRLNLENGLNAAILKQIQLTKTKTTEVIKTPEVKVKPDKLRILEPSIVEFDKEKANKMLVDALTPDFSKMALKTDFIPPNYTDKIFKQLKPANEAFLKLQERASLTATTITEALTPAINGFFSSLIDGSKKPFDAIKDALKQLIVQLAATVAKALVLTAVMNVIAPGSGSFGAGFLKNLGAGFGGLMGGAANFGGINVGSITGAANVGGQRLVAEVSGTSLKFLLDKTNGSIKRGF